MAKKKLYCSDLSYAPEPADHIKVHPTLRSAQQNNERLGKETPGRRLFPKGPLILALIVVSAAVTSFLALERIGKDNILFSNSSETSFTISDLASQLSRYTFAPSDDEVLLNCGNGYFTNKPLPGFDCVSVKEVKATRGAANRFITPPYKAD
jgi:hypothetical protein